MNLELYDKDNKLVCKLDDDDNTLRFYNIEDGMRIHVSSFLFTGSRVYPVLYFTSSILSVLHIIYRHPFMVTFSALILSINQGVYSCFFIIFR